MVQSVRVIIKINETIEFIKSKVITNRSTRERDEYQVYMRGQKLEVNVKIVDLCHTDVEEVEVRLIIMPNARMIDIWDVVVPERKKTTARNLMSKTTTRAWQFLLTQLIDKRYEEVIAWQNRKGTFCLKCPEVVAAMWGWMNGNDRMNYAKFSRVLRHYAQTEPRIIQKAVGRYCYQFDMKLIELEWDEHDRMRWAKAVERKDHTTELSRDS